MIFFPINGLAARLAAMTSPTRAQAVTSARRPGTFALVIDCATSTTTRRLTRPEGLQFNGHGAFSADGTRLMTSEVVAETSQGRIGPWDARPYIRLTDWPSHGIGPRDIRLLPDGRLAVSNDCIQTDPMDRPKLNLRTMRPTLTLLTKGGALPDQIDLPDLPQNSIRHLVQIGDITAFAMPWEGDPTEPVPQLGLWRSFTAPVLCEPTPAEAFTLQGYAGSIATTADRVLITSPKGGSAMIFAAPVATHRRADLCCAATHTDCFPLTNGLGTLWAAEDNGLTP